MKIKNVNSRSHVPSFVEKKDIVEIASMITNDNYDINDMSCHDIDNSGKIDIIDITNLLHIQLATVSIEF